MVPKSIFSQAAIFILVFRRSKTLYFFTAYWGSWGSYGSCSKTCGSGTKTRSRSCQGIGSCSGSSSESASCNHGTCRKLINNDQYIFADYHIGKRVHFEQSKTPKYLSSDYRSGQRIPRRRRIKLRCTR